MAFVLAIAGIIRLTTPWVKLQVTPSMLYLSALALATSKSHWICSGSSLSTFLSGGRQQESAGARTPDSGRRTFEDSGPLEDASPLDTVLG